MSSLESHLARHGGMSSIVRDHAFCHMQTCQAYSQLLQFPEVFVKRLCIKEVLQGHMGCVNRLAWNKDGTMLASGSDDHSVVLWHYPDTLRKHVHFMTQHEGNIFGVAFMPFSNNTQIATGAMDGSLQLHQLDAPPREARYKTLPASSRGPGAHAFEKVQTTEYFQHKSRIKAIDVDPTDANLLWSSSEDGTVQQFDIRCNPGISNSNRNLLIQLKQGSQPVGILSIKINKAKPWQIGVAAYDQFARIYDRRMLSLGQRQEPESSTQPSLKFVPPHLAMQTSRSGHDAFPTYIDFGRKGDRMVATYHGEHAYSFRTDGAPADSSTTRFEGSLQSKNGKMYFTQRQKLPKATPIDILSRAKSTELPPEAEAAKKEGNQAFFDSDENAAVWHYTKAIHLAPSVADLYINRATACLKRDWMGDSYSALADCERAISLDPTLVKPYYRRITALIALGQLEAAQDALQLFKAHFPDKINEYSRLEGSLRKELDTERQRSEAFRGHRNVHAGVSASPAANMDAAMETGIDENPGQSISPGMGNNSGANSSTVLQRLDSTEVVDSWEDLDRTDGDEMDMEEDFYEQPGIERYQYQQRFIGHRNLNTDIKEACYLGGHNDLVACGSDDGRVFIYNAETGYPVRCLQADEDVVNCIQPHPYLPTLATSGIENVVRLWEPGTFTDSCRSVMSLVKSNQQKMKDQACMFGRISPAMLSAISQRPDMWEMLMAIERQGPNDLGNPNGPQEGGCRIV